MPQPLYWVSLLLRLDRYRFIVYGDDTTQLYVSEAGTLASASLAAQVPTFARYAQSSPNKGVNSVEHAHVAANIMGALKEMERAYTLRRTCAFFLLTGVGCLFIYTPFMIVVVVVVIVPSRLWSQQ